MTREIHGFGRFLSAILPEVGLFMDNSKIASKAKISRTALIEFFNILEDTLIGKVLLPFDADDLIQNRKFYFFDNGVFNALRNDFSITPKTLGVLTEQFVLTQLMHVSEARRLHFQFFSYRKKNGTEIDFILKKDGNLIAVEVKNSFPNIDDLQALILFRKEYLGSECFCVHFGEKEEQIEGVWIMPFRRFF